MTGESTCRELAIYGDLERHAIQTLPAQKKRKERVGRTKPRIMTPALKGKSRIDEVVALAERIGMPLLPWQRFVMEDMLMVDDAGSYRRKTIGILVARQNGKTHLARMRILFGLINGERIVAMSSNRNMALDTFRDVASIITDHDFLIEMLKAKPRLANGQERIEFKNGGRYEIVAATRDGSRGKTADLLYIDELREITEEAWKAARPVTRARPNAQTITTSNAGDAFSTVLNDLRERALQYPSETFGWYEYSAPQHCKIWDKDAWAMANPALGYTITEDILEESVATNSVEATRTELLCQWVDSLQSPWPPGVIEDTTNSDLELPVGRPTVFAMDVSPSKRSGALVAGQLLDDGTIGVGIMQLWSSEVGIDDLKMAREIHEWVLKYNPQVMLYDKYATASIAQRLEQSGLICEDISGQKFYQACGELLDAFVNTRLVHSGQPELVNHLNNCAMKTNDAGWRIVRRKSAGDVTGAISLAMIVHQLSKPQSTPSIYFA
jgi:phage terminase large subunit-like protein